MTENEFVRPAVLLCWVCLRIF